MDVAVLPDDAVTVEAEERESEEMEKASIDKGDVKAEVHAV